MWFKQIQILQLPSTLNLQQDALEQALESLAFTPCLSSLPASLGWVSPVDQDQAPLVYAMTHYFMICLQFEEKILPATVVREKVKAKIKQIEANGERKVSGKQAQTMREEMTHTLLSQAFTKLTKVYAYIDTKSKRLILNTTHAKRTEAFLSIFKRCVQCETSVLEIKKATTIMTQWLTTSTRHLGFNIEKSCVLQDPNQQNRVIRCRQQNLYAPSILSLLKDGCEVKQIALSWNDQVNFVLGDDLTLRSIGYEDELIAAAKETAETEEQRFYADFMIMAEILDKIFNILFEQFVKEVAPKAASLATAS